MPKYYGLFRLEHQGLGEPYAPSISYTSSTTHLIAEESDTTLCGIQEVVGFVRVNQEHAQCPACLKEKR